MAFAKRMVLFFIVNIAMITTISILLSVLGVGPYLSKSGLNYESLAVFCLVWGMGGAFFSLAISRITAKWMMGVKVIDPQNPGQYQDLLQRVHLLAKAARLPAMPEVGVYESPEVNAFATGPSKKRSLVAVSTGLLHSMDRDQVEGVLAHEVAHIANGDMVTMTLVQGIINAFVMFIARIAAYAISAAIANRSDDSDEAPANPMVFHLVTIVLEIALGILGTMVVAYFSRAREFRADEGGAKLAGREKMRSALEKLLQNSNRIDTAHESLATLKISGRRGGFLALFSTHPPLEDRIARLK
jgi:heat shock protein HtpX